MRWHAIAIASVFVVATQASAAEKKYGPGASDTEIKLGQTSPFSGPASAYSVIAKTQAAYFKMINEQGGVNGRKINLITLDDAYSPPKTVEQTRKLVEQEEVAVILNPLGTPTGLAVRKYLNDKKVPQLFVGAGATLWGDHERFPWSIGFQPSYQAETAVYAKYVLKNKPDAKIALFYQNDDAGKDYGNGFKKGLGPENTAKMVVAEATYESTDPTIDSQIVKLKLSGANVLFMHAIPKQAAQAIRKVGEIGWKPDMFFLAATSTSVSSVLKPAGFDYSKDIISSYSFKDPNDPQWKDDKDVQAWHDFMKKLFSGRQPSGPAHRLWLCRGGGHRAGAQAVRRRSHPREHHEAGGQPRRHAAPDVARHQAEDVADRLFPDRSHAAAEVQWRDMGAVRRHHRE